MLERELIADAPILTGLPGVVAHDGLVEQFMVDCTDTLLLRIFVYSSPFLVSEYFLAAFRFARADIPLPWYTTVYYKQICLVHGLY